MMVACGCGCGTQQELVEEYDKAFTCEKCRRRCWNMTLHEHVAWSGWQSLPTGWLCKECKQTGR